ncbi:MAG: hypothetical protein IPL61_12660 [Myxococcales bacterium]|nr:hypothetical protein [Myxococcales bacterium]
MIDAVAAGTISGTAVKGRLRDATVSVYTFADGVRGAAPVGTGTTQADGSFTNVPVAEGTSGPLLVEVGGGGSYAEDSQPATVVSLDVNDRLRTVVPAFTDGGAVSGVVVTPATELAVSYLGWLVTAGQGGADLPARWTTAHGALEAMLGIASITTVVPSEPAQVDTLTAADRYGLVLLGLSRTAWTASTAGGGDAGAFGPTINAQKVTNLWSRDIRDGCLDGKAGATPLSYGGVGTLTDEATRLQLAQAIVAYLGDGARNVTAFTAPPRSCRCSTPSPPAAATPCPARASAPSAGTCSMTTAAPSTATARWSPSTAPPRSPARSCAARSWSRPPPPTSACSTPRRPCASRSR